MWSPCPVWSPRGSPPPPAPAAPPRPPTPPPRPCRTRRPFRPLPPRPDAAAVVQPHRIRCHRRHIATRLLSPNPQTITMPKALTNTSTPHVLVSTTTPQAPRPPTPTPPRRLPLLVMPKGDVARRRPYPDRHPLHAYPHPDASRGGVRCAVARPSHPTSTLRPVRRRKTKLPPAVDSDRPSGPYAAHPCRSCAFGCRTPERRGSGGRAGAGSGCPERATPRMLDHPPGVTNPAVVRNFFVAGVWRSR